MCLRAGFERHEFGVDPLVEHLREFAHVGADRKVGVIRSEEHTSELQSLRHLVCRLLLEKKNIEPDGEPGAGRSFVEGNRVAERAGEGNLARKKRWGIDDAVNSGKGRAASSRNSRSEDVI